MDWQEVIALTIVVITAVVMLRCWWRSRKSGNCGGGCACDKKQDRKGWE